MNSPSTGKQVLYVDVDDEITTIIDKMNTSEAKVVALVLPKRASVFQSLVNMKLLKRRADEAKKHIVLITSEAGLMPLAGLSGIHVAKTLQSKPEIPPVPLLDDANEGDQEEAVVADDEFDSSKMATAAIGDLAANAALKSKDTSDGPIELDDIDLPEDDGTSSLPPAGKPARNKKLKVPDFLRFRKRLILVVLVLLLLITGGIVAVAILPKATVTIKTDNTTVDSSVDLTLDTETTMFNADKKLVPAQTQQQQKVFTQAAPATGQQNNGDKATGTVTLTNCSADSTSVTVPAGTGVSANGQTFITQSSLTLSTSLFTGSGNCKSISGITSDNVDVTAQTSGSQFNIGPSNFSVAGFANVKGASTKSMSGGTDNVTKVVQQSDIDSAKQKLNAGQDQTTIKAQLKQSLESNGLYALPSTFNAGAPTISTSAQPGQAADNVTVTENVTYTMYGAKRDYLKQLITESAKKQMDSSKQSILDDGLETANYVIPKPASSGTLPISMSVTITAGPKLDADTLAKQFAGKKSGDVRDSVKAVPGVTDVSIQYSPFWVTSMPNKSGKITVIFQKHATKSSANAHSN